MNLATRALRFANLASLAALAITVGVATAGAPSPQASTIPSHIVLVGSNAAGVPDALGTFQVTVRRASGFPEAHASVLAVFHNAPDLRVYTTQPAGVLFVNCDPTYGPVVAAEADGNAVATLTIYGRADRSRPTSPLARAEIYADGVLLGSIPVAAFDQDGGGVGASDLSYFIEDFFSGEYRQRSDYNGDGVVGAADLSVWEGAFFASGSELQGGTSLCP